MKNSKVIAVFIFLFLLIVATTLVSAQTATTQPATSQPAGDPRDSIDWFFKAIFDNKAARIIVGDFSNTEASTSELFFIKVLVFILLVGLIGFAVRRVPGIGESTSLTILISIVVSLISVRFITSETLVKTIWLPYGVLGIFLATLLPFILGFFFIESFNSRMFRQIAWSLYLVVFAGLAWFRWDALKGLFPAGQVAAEAGQVAAVAWYNNGAMIYVATAILSLILIIFDSKIRAIMHQARYKDIKERDKTKAAINIDIKIEDLYDKLSRTTNPTHIEYLKGEIKRLEGDRARVLR